LVAPAGAPDPAGGLIRSGALAGALWVMPAADWEAMDEAGTQEVGT